MAVRITMVPTDSASLKVVGGAIHVGPAHGGSRGHVQVTGTNPPTNPTAPPSPPPPAAPSTGAGDTPPVQAYPWPDVYVTFVGDPSTNIDTQDFMGSPRFESLAALGEAARRAGRELATGRPLFARIATRQPIDLHELRKAIDALPDDADLTIEVGPDTDG